MIFDLWNSTRLVDEEAVFEAHRLIGHRLVDPESVGVLGGHQVAVLEPALERRALDLEMDPAIDVVARGALQPAALLLGQTGGRSGVSAPPPDTGRTSSDAEAARPRLEYAAAAEAAARESLAIVVGTV